MVKIVDEKPWSYVLFEFEDGWMITFLLNNTPVEADYSMKLTPEEIEELKTEAVGASALVDRIAANLTAYHSRFLNIPIWP